MVVFFDETLYDKLSMDIHVMRHKIHKTYEKRYTKILSYHLVFTMLITS